MPSGDRSGPNGMGPMTGRGAGLCTGNATGGFATASRNVGRGRGAGRGMGRGMGRGAGMGAIAPTSQTQQAAVLKAQVAQLEASLATVRDQLQSLSNQEGE